MNTHTLYLDLLILIATFFPAGFASSVGGLLQTKRQEQIDVLALTIMASSFVILCFSLFLVKRDVFFLTLPGNLFYGIAILLGFISLLSEYLLNFIMIYFFTGEKSKGIVLHGAWTGKYSFFFIFLTLLIAVGEEFIYRQVWFELLTKDFNLNIMFILLITSLGYGLNHLLFGITSVISKIIPGMIYGGLYIYSDYSIIPPIIAHVTQNLSLFGLTKE